MSWWDWFEAKRDERKQVPESSQEQLRKGNTWGLKYPKMGKIFDLYRFGDEPGEQTEVDRIKADLNTLLPGQTSEITQLATEQMEDQL